jgi:DNA-binding ferritin-like protein
MELFQKLGDKAREIGGKARDIGENIGERAKGVGGKAMEITKRSGELIEITRLKYEISKLDKEMENDLGGLGLLVYQKYRGIEGQDEEIERLCRSIIKLEEDMKAAEAEISKLSPKPPFCPVCNVELPQGGKFCSYCGKEVIKDEEVQE